MTALTKGMNETHTLPESVRTFLAKRRESLTERLKSLACDKYNHEWNLSQVTTEIEEIGNLISDLNAALGADS